MTTTTPMMARLSSRSRILMLQAIRPRLGIGAGDLVLFEERAGEIVLRSVRAASRDDQFAMFGEWSGEADEAA